VVTTPQSLPVISAHRFVKLVDQLRDLGTHHGEDMRSSRRGEGVNGSTRNHDERSGIDFLSQPIDLDLELAIEADERFLTAVMHMERSLIAFARVEPPVPDNEVGHRDRILATRDEANIAAMSWPDRHRVRHSRRARVEASR
jgi:hypothetical protein